MALPVITDVFRCTMNFSGGGATSHNVFHVLSSAPSNETDVAEALDAAAAADMFKPMSSSWSLDSWTVLALDGASAGITISASTGNNGGSTGGTILSSAAILSLQTTTRGPKGRGRLFMGPIGEGANEGGYLDLPTRNDWVSEWAAFAGRLDAGTPSLTLVVASYVHSEAYVVSNLVGRLKLGTQRRRQDQLPPA